MTLGKVKREILNIHTHIYILQKHLSIVIILDTIGKL